MKRLASLVLFGALIACSSTTPPPEGENAVEPASSTVIVGLREGVRTANAASLEEVVWDVLASANAAVGGVGLSGVGDVRVLGVIEGFVLDGASEVLVGELRADERVEFVEWDSVVSVASEGVPWGLDRVNQRALPLDGVFNSVVSGDGVTVFVVDTGIRASHSEFGGRVMPGFSSITDGGGWSDCNGHGTHVAGTIGGSSVGVARSVRLVPVRVLDCSGAGYLSHAIAGLNWVNAQSVRPAVVNMSLGGRASSSLDRAVRKLYANGVLSVAASGNSNVDACRVSPAREPRTLTVGATTRWDEEAAFSNFGSCVDVLAPGTGIRSASHVGDSSFVQYSGTSMAAPHATGIAALHLGLNPEWTPQQLAQLVTLSATSNVIVGGKRGSPNRLVFADPSLRGPGVPKPEPAPEPDPEPEPEPEPPATDCQMCTLHVAVLTSNEPSMTTTPVSTTFGTLVATIITPPNQTATIELQELHDGVWRRVTSITNATSDTPLLASINSGTFRYRIHSTQPGEYHLMTHHRIDSTILSSGRSYLTTGFLLNGGTQNASLIGPAGTNFDLRLERLERNLWRPVAASLTRGSTESIEYEITPGVYRWRIQSRSGTGAFTLITWVN